MQSVELLLDPATDAAVRAEWAALSAAGLPSQADHRGETNAPHVSVLVAETFPGEESLAATTSALPLPVQLGAPVVTLARGIPADGLATALAALGPERAGVPELVGEATVLRRWDAVARRAWTV